MLDKTKSNHYYIVKKLKRFNFEFSRNKRRKKIMKSQEKKLEVINQNVETLLAQVIEQAMFTNYYMFAALEFQGCAAGHIHYMINFERHCYGHAYLYYKSKSDAQKMFDLLATNLELQETVTLNKWSDESGEWSYTTLEGVKRHDWDNDYQPTAIGGAEKTVQKLKLIAFINSEHPELCLQPKHLLKKKYPQCCQLRALFEDFDGFTNNFESCAKAGLYELHEVNRRDYVLVVSYKGHELTPALLYFKDVELAANHREKLKEHEGVANATLYKKEALFCYPFDRTQMIAL